jgi:hypothetical protein
MGGNLMFLNIIVRLKSSEKRINDFYRIIANNICKRVMKISDATVEEKAASIDLVYCHLAVKYINKDQIEKILKDIYLILDCNDAEGTTVTSYLKYGKESIFQETNLTSMSRSKKDLDKSMPQIPYHIEWVQEFTYPCNFDLKFETNPVPILHVMTKEEINEEAEELKKEAEKDIITRVSYYVDMKSEQFMSVQDALDSRDYLQEDFCSLLDDSCEIHGSGAGMGSVDFSFSVDFKDKRHVYSSVEVLRGLLRKNKIKQAKVSVDYMNSSNEEINEESHEYLLQA